MPRTPEPARPRLSLEDVLARMSRRERERAGYPVEPMSADDVIRILRPEIKLPSLPIKGCILRFIIFIFVLIALGLGGLFLVFGGGLERFVIDVGQSTGLVTGIPDQTTRGIEAYRRGDLVTAERELMQAAASYPRSGEASLYISKIRAEAGDLAGAEDHLRTAIAREPDNPAAHRDLGLNHLAQSQAAVATRPGEMPAAGPHLEEADRELALAVSLDPTDRAAVGYRGCVLLALGNSAEGSRYLNAAGGGPWEGCAGADSAGR